MNVYTRTFMIPIDRDARIAALDEATGRKIPDDLLQYVLLPMMDHEQQETETMHTVKMQPRDVMRELKNYSRLQCGCCGVFAVNWATAVCMAPSAVANFIGRGGVLGLVSLMAVPVIIGSACVSVCCEVELCNMDNVDPEWFRDLLNNCIGDRMPCAGADYRLKRSCCFDALDLANYCCCCATMSCDEPARRNGPEAMWME